MKENISSSEKYLISRWTSIIEKQFLFDTLISNL